MLQSVLLQENSGLLLEKWTQIAQKFIKIQFFRNEQNELEKADFWVVTRKLEF